jgi:hypothetical protein
MYVCRLICADSEQCSLSQLAVQFLRSDEIAVDSLKLVVALNQLGHLMCEIGTAVVRQAVGVMKIPDFTLYKQ